MRTKLGINGFGRTGARCSAPPTSRTPTIEWVGINDTMDLEMLAHLLRHDSVYGLLPRRGRGARRRSSASTGSEMPVFAETDPANAALGRPRRRRRRSSPAGFFRDRADAANHLEAGARKVIISAPAKDPNVTVALGINFETRL